MAVAKTVSSVSSCGYCSQPLEAVRLTCSGCFQVSYCDIDCQWPHWKYHRKVCKAAEEPLPPTTQKAQSVAASQRLIPAAAAPASASSLLDEVDEKENLSQERRALRQALQGKQERWAKTRSTREHLRTQIWPHQAQSWEELEYTLKPDLDAFFKNKVKLKALDLGACSCNNVSVLIDVGFIHIAAVDNLAGFKDIAEKTVHALKADAEDELLEISLLEKSITPNDLEIFPRDGSFGAIIARRIFEFCAPDDFENLLIASYASLEKGGCFIVSVNLLDSAEPNLYDRFWKGGEWGFTSRREVNAAENFLKSIGFIVKRLDIDYGPNHPEVLFFCQKTST